MDDVGFEQLFVLPHIQNNGTDKLITFFDLTIDARSDIRGQGAMSRGLGVSPVDLGNSPRKLGVKFNGRGLLRKVDASTPLPDM